MTHHCLEKLILTVYPFQRSGTISDSSQSLYLPMVWTLTVHKSVITSLSRSILVWVLILSLKSNPDQQQYKVFSSYWLWMFASMFAMILSFSLVRPSLIFQYLLFFTCLDGLLGWFNIIVWILSLISVQEDFHFHLVSRSLWICQC